MKNTPWREKIRTDRILHRKPTRNDPVSTRVINRVQSQKRKHAVIMRGVEMRRSNRAGEQLIYSFISPNERNANSNEKRFRVFRDDRELWIFDEFFPYFI